jgi:hypothetical protein
MVGLNGKWISNHVHESNKKNVNAKSNQICIVKYLNCLFYLSLQCKLLRKLPDICGFWLALVRLLNTTFRIIKAQISQGYNLHQPSKPFKLVFFLANDLNYFATLVKQQKLILPNDGSFDRVVCDRNFQSFYFD